MKTKIFISEFNITGNPIPENICDKIQKYHIDPMMDVRNKLNIPLYPSQKSGYRPRSWELAHGRSGNSQHTFNGKGAVDWTTTNFKKSKDKLLKSIIENTEYTRIAVYNTFIHCDYKATLLGRRELYSSGSDSKWVFNKYI